MAASKEEIREWLQRGIDQHATHVIIAVDTWDYEDYPVFVSAAEDIHEKVNSYDVKQDRIMEVYSLQVDIEAQLNETRAWNL